MNICKQLIAVAALSSVTGLSGAAAVSLTKLTGLTGGTLAATAVYMADLSTVGLGSILSISISDNSSALGGSPGQFSGFDFDAIKLSNTLCADAACAAAATGVSAFDFISGVNFTPGTQRAPADAKLFGTGPGGNTVDDTIATLGLFDGESSTIVPFGFISMGDDGRIDFNLTAAVLTAGLYLYLGEVGDNGEAAASDIVVRDTAIAEPSSLALAGLALFGAATAARRRRQR